MTTPTFQITQDTIFSVLGCTIIVLAGKILLDWRNKIIKKRIAHSENLMNDALSPLIDFLLGRKRRKRRMVTAGGTEIDSNRFGSIMLRDEGIHIEMFYPKNHPKNRKYFFDSPKFKGLQQHLEKYKNANTAKNLAEEFSSLRNDAGEWLKHIQSLLQKLKDSVIDRVNLEVWNGRGGKPSSYIMPKRTAYNIYNAIKTAIYTEVKPTANLTSPSNIPNELIWDGQLIILAAKSQQKDAAKKAIDNLLLNKKCKNMITQLIKKREKLESKLDSLTKKLRVIKARIESNHPLKGKCDICRKFIHSSLLTLG